MRHSGIDIDAAIKALDNERSKLVTVSACLAVSICSLMLFSTLSSWIV